jgi:hypothetical protein
MPKQDVAPQEGDARFAQLESSPRKSMAWEWACRFADQLLNHMAGVCGFHRVAHREQSFSSRFQ